MATTNLIFQAFWSSDTFGKAIFFILFALSFLTWIILIEKVLLFRKCYTLAQELQNTFFKAHTQILQIFIKKTLFDHPFMKIYTTLKEKTTAVLEKNLFFAKKEQAFLSKSDIESIETDVINAISKERKKLEKNLFILATSTSLAPFIGILGTVWGILICLSELQKGNAIHANSFILSSLSMALATTVLGLIIAIPALISYSYLKNFSQRLQGEMENFATFLLSTVELQYRKVDPL